MKRSAITKYICIILCLAFLTGICGCAAGNTAPEDSEDVRQDTETEGTETPDTEDTSGDFSGPDYDKYRIEEADYQPTGMKTSLIEYGVLEMEPDNHSALRLVSEEITVRSFRYSFPTGDYTMSPFNIGYQVYLKLEDGKYEVISTDGETDTIVIGAGDAEMHIRQSTYAFSESTEDTEGEVDLKVYVEPQIRKSEFPTPFEIEWSDIEVRAKRDDGSGYYSPEITEDIQIINKEDRKYSSAESLSFGYSVKGPVTVYAFIAKTEEGLSVLVDPEYMYGIPMFCDSKFQFIFGGDEKIRSDSILISASCTGSDSLPFTGYAYAKVVLKGLECESLYTDGDVDRHYTAMAESVEVLDEFTSITEYGISQNDHVITSGEKDPDMERVYEAVMASKDLIYTEDTEGIVFLDLDFDGTPEVLVTKTGDNIVEYPAGQRNLHKIITSVYTVGDGGLVYCDKMELPFVIRNTRAGYMAVSELNDGTPAWYVSISENDDCLLTFENGSLVYHPLFTTEISGDGARRYFYRGEEIIPEEVYETFMFRGEERTQKYYVWNGVKTQDSAGFIVFDQARRLFTEELGTSYSLYSSWIGIVTDSTTYNYAPVRFVISPRDFAHRIAYLIDDFYYGGTTGVDHRYNFGTGYAKPVIYLYPEKETEVTVRIGFRDGGCITCSYPEYDDGWTVTAMPGGALYDSEGNEYYCLFWEGLGNAEFRSDGGYCVSGNDTAAFLREKLMQIGLSARETNEFIIYWMPLVKDNPYNLITFHTDDYDSAVPLYADPVPDTVIRVFVTFTPSEEYVETEGQQLPSFEREGFTLVEWGGTITE